MLDSLLESVITGSTITASAFLVCTLISMLLGVGVAALCMYKNKYSQSFAVTLAMLPAMVAVVIMLVNFVIAYLTRNKKKDDDEETPANPDQTVTA